MTIFFEQEAEGPTIAGRPVWLLLFAGKITEEQAIEATDIYERRLAESSLAGYAKRVVGVTPAAHHKLICDAIDRLLADEYDELIILAPPGSAKSTYTSIALAGYFLGKWPSKLILSASNTIELAEKWGKRVRDIVADEEHQIVFKDSRLSKDSSAAGKWATTQGGEFRAIGVGGSILGYRADLALIDDPFTSYEQAQSETQAIKVHEWYENDFATRLKPGGKTVLICQRLARNDLAGYLIDRNKIRKTKRQFVLKLRMEADPAMDALEGAQDPLQRAPGAPLWPEYYTPDMIEDAKRNDYKWKTLYQQEPPSDMGVWVSPKDIMMVEREDSPPIEWMSMYLLTDLAISVNSGDYTVMLIVGIATDGKVWVVDAWRAQVSTEESAEQLLNLHQTYKPLECLIDDDGFAKGFIPLLGRIGRERSIMPHMVMLPIRGQDKETRAAPLRGMFRRGMIRLIKAPWNDWLIKELLMFPNAIGSGVDDGVDALGLIGRRLMALATPAPQPTAKAPPPTIHQITLNDLWEQREQGQHTFGRGRL